MHLTLDNVEAAENAFRMALDGEKKLGSALGQAINYANLGSLLESQEKIDSARWYYKRSMQLNQKARPLQNSLFKICSFHHIFVPL